MCQRPYFQIFHFPFSNTLYIFIFFLLRFIAPQIILSPKKTPQIILKEPAQTVKMSNIFFIINSSEYPFWVGENVRKKKYTLGEALLNSCWAIYTKRMGVGCKLYQSDNGLVNKTLEKWWAICIGLGLNG